jgi:hypothetical protein
MKMKHQIYTRIINGEEYYIVKNFLTFPDTQIPDVLQHIGMHKELLTACRIAKLSNTLIGELCPDTENVVADTHSKDNKPAFSWLAILNPLRLFPSYKLSNL